MSLLSAIGRLRKLGCSVEANTPETWRVDGRAIDAQTVKVIAENAKTKQDVRKYFATNQN